MTHHVRFREKTIYKNRNGSIVSLDDMMFGGTVYLLFDSDLNFVKELHVSFVAATICREGL